MTAGQAGPGLRSRPASPAWPAAPFDGPRTEGPPGCLSTRAHDSHRVQPGEPRRPSPPARRQLPSRSPPVRTPRVRTPRVRTLRARTLQARNPSRNPSHDR
ncbi:hypothetical protein LK06_009245 [Streptomyces pluripotens]|nr:hypothetical protein LK06_009245 [Streptomyces pluripotens]